MRDRPLCDLLHQDRPGRAPPGSNQASCKGSEDTQGDPRVCTSLAAALRNRCQAAKATCSRGRARATPDCRGRAKENQDGASIWEPTPPWAWVGRAGPGTTTSGTQAQPRARKPSACSLRGSAPDRHVCFAGSAVLLTEFWWTQPPGRGPRLTFLQPEHRDRPEPPLPAFLAADGEEGAVPAIVAMIGAPCYRGPGPLATSLPFIFTEGDRRYCPFHQ